MAAENDDNDDQAAADEADVDSEDQLATELLIPEPPASATVEEVAVLPDSASNSQGSAQELPGDDWEIDANTQPIAPLESDPEVAGKEKGLKRKFGARAISGLSKSDINIMEPIKRQRDDSDKDDDPRETKRPSPPPEAESSSSAVSSSPFKLVW